MSEKSHQIDSAPEECSQGSPETAFNKGELATMPVKVWKPYTERGLPNLFLTSPTIMTNSPAATGISQ